MHLSSLFNMVSYSKEGLGQYLKKEGRKGSVVGREGGTNKKHDGTPSWKRP